MCSKNQAEILKFEGGVLPRILLIGKNGKIICSTVTDGENPPLRFITYRFGRRLILLQSTCDSKIKLRY